MTIADHLYSLIHTEITVTGICEAINAEIADTLGVCIRTVQRGLDYLESVGTIHRVGNGKARILCLGKALEHNPYSQYQQMSRFLYTDDLYYQSLSEKRRNTESSISNRDTNDKRTKPKRPPLTPRRAAYRRLVAVMVETGGRWAAYQRKRAWYYAVKCTLETIEVAIEYAQRKARHNVGAYLVALLDARHGIAYYTGTDTAHEDRKGRERAVRASGGASSMDDLMGGFMSEVA